MGNIVISITLIIKISYTGDILFNITTVTVVSVLVVNIVQSKISLSLIVIIIH